MDGWYRLSHFISGHIFSHILSQYYFPDCRSVISGDVEDWGVTKLCSSARIDKAGCHPWWNHPAEMKSKYVLLCNYEMIRSDITTIPSGRKQQQQLIFILNYFLFLPSPISIISSERILIFKVLDQHIRYPSTCNVAARSNLKYRTSRLYNLMVFKSEPAHSP